MVGHYMQYLTIQNIGQCAGSEDDWIAFRVNAVCEPKTVHKFRGLYKRRLSIMQQTLNFSSKRDYFHSLGMHARTCRCARCIVMSYQATIDYHEHERGPITMALGSAPAEDFLEELRQEAGLASWPSWQLSGARPGPGESTVQAQDRILRVWMEYLRAALTDV
jgi:hypothetical protein